MAAFARVFSLLFLLISLGGVAKSIKYRFDFESDLEGWQSYRGTWRWSDKGSLTNPLPTSGGNGFAVIDKAYDSDELYTPNFAMEHGGTFSINFFVKSKWAGSNSMQIDIYQNGVKTERLLDLSMYSSPSSDDWMTATATIEPKEGDILLAIFCYNGESALAGELLNGCAVDEITVEVFSGETTVMSTTQSALTNATTEISTESPTDPSTKTPTESTTENVTDPTTEPSTEQPTQASTKPTVPTTQVTTEYPATDTSTYEPSDKPTDRPITEPTDTPTDEPTDFPTYEPTDSPTYEPTDGPTDDPTYKTTYFPTYESTDGPTDDPTDFPTYKPTDSPTDDPTYEPTDAPTDAPTEVTTGITTVESTTATDKPTEGTTDEPTDGPTDGPTDEPTDSPTYESTDNPTSDVTYEPTEGTTDSQTDTPTVVTTNVTTDEPTDVPTRITTDITTEETTAASTGYQTNTTEESSVGTTMLTSASLSTTMESVPSTSTYPSTETPQGPLIFDFLQDTQGWTLANMNGAEWQRSEFDSSLLPVSDPPYGPWVLNIHSDDVFSSTVIAQSPQLEATEETMKVQVTFYMDGTQSFPCHLKVRRRKSFSSYDSSPILNLDPYGDQENFNWITFTGYLRNLEVGEAFSIILEGSLGGYVNNTVAVDRIVLEGVRPVLSDPSEFFDFENDLLGWTQGNMDGGRWVLQNLSSVDPSHFIPSPKEGSSFIIAERFDIHSGVIALESPGFKILPGQRKKVHIKFWVRGSVVYPASLRLRKKSIGGVYDDLPFLNLAQYGDIDNPDWITLDKDYVIPVDETEGSFQLVIEADLGSDEANMIAVDDLRIITEYIGE